METTFRTRRLVNYFVQHALLLATLAGAEPLQVPRQLGDFKFVEDSSPAVEPVDRELFEEYGLIASFSAKYADSKSRSMTMEAFRFDDSLGAHAAFLASTPNHGVSPMIWHIEAITGGGVTVMEFHNYLLRFSGALPTVSSALEEMLAKLPGVTGDEKPWDLSGRYLDPGSARIVLGPVSLARFERRIPPSIAAFRLGTKARLASFETPAGRMTEVVFEYPTEVLAREQLQAIARLTRTIVRLDRTCVGVVLEPLNPIEAQDLLADPFCGPLAVTFGPAIDYWDGPMTLSDGFGFALAAFVLGAVVVLFKRATAKPNSPANSIIPRDQDR